MTNRKPGALRGRPRNAEPLVRVSLTITRRQRDILLSQGRTLSKRVRTILDGVLSTQQDGGTTQDN